MTVAAAIETGAGGRSEPGHGPVPVRPAGRTPVTAGTGEAPASSRTSDAQAGQSFRSNWQAQMAVFGQDTEADLNGPSAERAMTEAAPETARSADAARGTAQGGSGRSFLAPSLRMAGTPTVAWAPPVRMVGLLVGTQAGEGNAQTGASGSGLNRAQLPVALPPPTAPQPSAKAAAKDDPKRSESTGNALPAKAKPEKPAEAAAVTLSPGAPVAFATVPAAVIAPAAAKVLPSAAASSLPAAFAGKSLSDGSFASPRGIQGTAAANAIQPSSFAAASEIKQSHDELPPPLFNERYLAESNSPSDARPTSPGTGLEQPPTGMGTAAPQTGITTPSTDGFAPASGHGSAPGPVTESIEIRSGGPELSVPLAERASSPVETAEAGRIDTQVAQPLPGLAPGQHATANQGRAESGTAEVEPTLAPVSGQEINRVALPGNPAVEQTVSAPIATQIQGDPAAAKSISASVQNAKRGTRGAEAIGNGTVPVQAPLAAASGESTSNLHDLAGGPAIASAAAGHDAISPSPSVHETFAALDSDPAPGAINWTHAGARQAEAGFEDPALGWVGVRADLSGGGVHATLLPGSAEAAQALGQHMDGLNAYMAQQHTPVESLAMGAPEFRDANHGAQHELGQGMNQGTNQGMNQGAGQGTDQRQGRNAQTQPWAEPESSSTLRATGVSGTASAASLVQPAGQEAAARVQSSTGMHISVVA